MTEEQEEYQAYKDAYYEGTYGQDEHNQIDTEGTAEAEEERGRTPEDGSTVELGHVAETKCLVCRRCQQEFPTNNQAHPKWLFGDGRLARRA